MKGLELDRTEQALRNLQTVLETYKRQKHSVTNLEWVIEKFRKGFEESRNKIKDFPELDYLNKKTMQDILYLFYSAEKVQQELEFLFRSLITNCEMLEEELEEAVEDIKDSIGTVGLFTDELPWDL